MSRSKNPVYVILTMTLVGAFVSALIRFAYTAYLIVQAGESLSSVPVKLLLIDVMELHLFALYGAGVGILLGMVLALIDFLRYGSQTDDYSWKVKEVYKPFVDDEVKARRMAIGDQYLKEKPARSKDADTE